MTTPIKTLLIANRGEIACRIMRTAQAQGICCVVVYSDADADAHHVRMADKAVHIGAPAATDSYLNGARIVQAAQDTGADAIHPGYGFLSENPDFVDMVTAAGLTFVGPSGDAIRAMGLKNRAKAIMAQAGVPVVPGYDGADQDAGVLAEQAAKIGYPVMIKAIAGGGGKGMRLVERAGEFAEALASARAESRAAFGDDTVLIEKYISAPRHIEVQVFGDGTDAIHLFERDCSLQRRHQKIIEEAPAPGMTDGLRAAMGQAAVTAAKAIGYRGAGTVEFIVDGSGRLREDGFWFMEMNTRLQVEHPVTEAVTGIDLVDWQLQVASGAPLPARQRDTKPHGHAVEARLYAEDPANDFLPATGRISHLSCPDTLRIDTGVDAGDDVSPHYDPMIAKVISHGADRAAAFDQLGDGLAKIELAGIKTNIGFLHRLTQNPDVRAGRLDTGLIARDLDVLTAPPVPDPCDIAQAALALCGVMGNAASHLGFALHGPLSWSVDIDSHTVHMTPNGPHAMTCTIAGETVVARKHGDTWRFNGAPPRAHHISGRSITYFGAAPMTLTVPDPLARQSNQASGDNARARMPGLLRDVFVKVGDTVALGDRLATLEAMKMEHAFRAPRAGIIATLPHTAGEQVVADAVIVSLHPPDSDA